MKQMLTLKNLVWVPHQQVFPDYQLSFKIFKMHILKYDIQLAQNTVPYFFFQESENILKEIKEKRDKINLVEADENNDFFTPTPEKSPIFEKRNQLSEKNISTGQTYSVFRRARKIKPKDNIGLDFFHQRPLQKMSLL